MSPIRPGTIPVLGLDMPTRVLSAQKAAERVVLGDPFGIGYDEQELAEWSCLCNEIWT
jgi:hypothetical protein